MAFNNPEGFWLLLMVPCLALLGVLLALLSRRDRNRFAGPELFDGLSRSVSPVRRRIGQACFFAGLALAVIALAQPRFGTKTEIVKRMGVDVVIALDTSASMLAEDVKPSRIMQAKYEIGQFIDNLKGDRVAILAFTGKPFVQCPLTGDYAAAKTLLDFVNVGSVPEPGTNIANAIDGALDMLKRGSDAASESQLIILFTDGENLSGDPLAAARKAGLKGVHIFTVGVGTTGSELIPLRNEKGQLQGYKQNSKGEVVKTSLDEETLRKIADGTRGAYLREDNGEVNVKSILDGLGDIKKTDLNERRISRLQERYQIPLGFSLFFLLAWLLIGERSRQKTASPGGKQS
ncbi:MAG: VWA domain-containing protein [Candidatus Latescibacter sp.]|nr:VWA domain-containing protein [Candidatus Latescibacter sp.]